MKNILLVPFACFLFLTLPGFSEEEKGGTGDVVDEVSEEAAILRALVEEYKAKTAKMIPPPEVPTVKKALVEVPKTETVVEQIGKIESIPAEFANPKVSSPEPPKMETQSLSALAEEVRKVVQPEKSVEKPEGQVASTTESVTSVIPAPNAPATPQVVEKMAGNVEVKAGGVPGEAISAVNSLITNQIEPVDSVIAEAGANVETEMKSDIANVGSIIIKDAPPQAPEISQVPKMDPPLKVTTQIPAIEETETTEEGSAKAASAAVAASENPIGNAIVETAEKTAPGTELEGSVMKAPQESVAVEKAPEEKPEVAKVDQMKKSRETNPSEPEVAEASSSTKETPPPTRRKAAPKNEEDKPLVVATKRPAPANGEMKASSEEVALAATEPAAVPVDAGPAATAKSVTPLKDLGRKLFGAKSSGPRGSIFKRKAVAEAPAE